MRDRGVEFKSWLECASTAQRALCVLCSDCTQFSVEYREHTQEWLSSEVLNGPYCFRGNFLHVTLYLCCFNTVKAIIVAVVVVVDRKRRRAPGLHKNNCAFVYLHLTELKLITRPVTTTTPTPYVYTTAKPPRRKPHQGHNHKSHDTSNRVKEILLPNNLQENEIVGPAAGGSIEGMYRLQWKLNSNKTTTRSKIQSRQIVV